MKFYPSVLATWMILAWDNAWANELRVTNSNHISHGQNDIRHTKLFTEVRRVSK